MADEVTLTEDEKDAIVFALDAWDRDVLIYPAIERIVTERLAARLTPWEVLRRAAQTVTGSEREWLLLQADGWEASGLTDRPAEQPDDEVHQWLRSKGLL